MKTKNKNYTKHIILRWDPWILIFEWCKLSFELGFWLNQTLSHRLTNPATSPYQPSNKPTNLHRPTTTNPPMRRRRGRHWREKKRRGRERERERENRFLMREERWKNKHFFITFFFLIRFYYICCYNKLPKMTVYCSKFVKFFSNGTIDIALFLLFVVLKIAI